MYDRRTIFVAPWDHFGMILKSFRDHFGIALGSFLARQSSRGGSRGFRGADWRQQQLLKPIELEYQQLVGREGSGLECDLWRSAGKRGAEEGAFDPFADYNKQGDLQN